jgi:hypothetical protein
VRQAFSLRALRMLVSSATRYKKKDTERVRDAM